MSIDDLTISVEQEIRNVSMARPHVVILGAGASVAAFPNGDKNGNRLPIMSDLTRTLGLTDLLNQHSIEHEWRNFEDVYSEIHANPTQKTLVKEIEHLVAQYLAQMELPDYPTLYDHLLLSLRPKDLIGTFNWDPFLYDACTRNHKRAHLPRVVYLHGNVRIGYCLKDMRKGLVGIRCSQCGQPFTPSRLLFPIKQKEYSSDNCITNEWSALRCALAQAYLVTIFGYSAPKTDVEAVDLMKTAWGRPEERNLEDIEIIDIRPEDDLRQTWSDFIHTHHYSIENDFYESFIVRHPRRTCEATWSAVMECRFLTDHALPIAADFEELYAWYQPLLDAESKAASNGSV